jgi:hypothetical protein
LINGGRGSRGFRNDDDFYERYVRPTFPNRSEWEDWKNGHWRNYWFAFWNTVKDYYTPQAKKLKGQQFEIWSKSNQSNLTKGVGLKIFQRFYMEEMTKKMEKTIESLDVLKEVLSDEEAEKKIAEKTSEKALPADIEEFCNRVRSEFLDSFPVRFFTANWETSLDDSTGQEKLLVQMREAFERDNWRASGGGVFVPNPNS